MSAGLCKPVPSCTASNCSSLKSVPTASPWGGEVRNLTYNQGGKVLITFLAAVLPTNTDSTLVRKILAVGSIGAPGHSFISGFS